MQSQKKALDESLLSQQQTDHESSVQKLDHKPKQSYLNKIPEIDGSNLISSLLFGWLYSFLSYGWKKTVDVNSMPKLPQQMQSWNEFERMKLIFENIQKSKREGFTLIRVLVKTYFCQFTTIILYLIVLIGMQGFSPYLTAMMMRYRNHRQDYESYYGGMMFAIVLLFEIVRSLSETHINYRFTKLGITMTNNLTLFIFIKSLKYPSIAQKEFSQSQILNYSQVDAERMSGGGYEIAAAILAPVQIIVGIWMMYHFIGISFLSGIGILFVTIFSTYITAKKGYHYNKEMLEHKDERMKVTQEMLDIIRYIKINSIEKFFYNKVDEKRMEEIKYYKKKGFMDVLNIFIYWLACPLILSATFFTYIKLGNEMTSEVAFTTIMIFTTLQYPIRLLPNSISALIQMFASIKRIQKYLYAKEIQTKHLNYVKDPDMQHAVRIERGNFWFGVEKEDDVEKNKQKKEDDKKKEEKQKKAKKNQKQQIKNQSRVSINADEEESDKTSSFINQNLLNKQGQQPKYVHVLKDISTTIKKGSFTIIIGDIGSGKSSLLMAILNEMIADEQASLEINGSIAYSSQRPWIMSASVKDNIIFQLPYDEIRFCKVIRYASLEQDLKILPFGIDTEIGEKGINISGGQKARISLARALYSNKDIYLLDDILSAVDVHVGEYLMHETLLGYLKSKTIIMPTHALKYAEFVDEIIVMKKGRIVRKGHFNDIVHTTEFQEVFQKEKKKTEKNVDEENKQVQQQIKSMPIKDESLLAPKKKEQLSTSDKLVRQLMLPEDQQVGEVDYQIFKEYLRLNGGYFNFGFLICFAMLMWISFSTAASMIMQKWCEDPLGLSYDLYLYAGLSIGSNIFIFYRAYKLVMAGAIQGEKVHKQTMKSLLYASLGDFFNRVPVGRIINRLTKDLRQLDEVIAFKIGNVLANGFSLIGNLVICVYASTPFVLIPIVIIGYISYRLKKYYMKTQIEVSRFEKSTNSPIVSGFISTIRGLSTIRAYHLNQQFIDKQVKYFDINKRVRLTKAGMESWFSINLTYLSFFVNMVAIGYCLLGSSDGLNASLVGLLMIYAINLSSDIIGTTNAISAFETKIVSLQRIYSFMKIEPQSAYLQYCSNWTNIEQGSQNVIKRGEIEFKGMNARYRHDLPDVLKELNLTIKAGQKVGIVGRTGAGKTTIINTLLRITQISDGNILIDGMPIQDYLIKNLRYGVTMIDQEPTLIKSTFKQNLDITGSYTNEELYEILKDCNLYETIMDKGGLDALVSNDSLSAGQKQLLCICRAFLKHSKIVLVDEATANIDVKNDSLIQKVISEKFTDCTVLTIAHRLSTLANSDKILVMEDGRVIEFGSPRELEQKENGFYKDMVLKNAKEFLT